MKDVAAGQQAKTDTGRAGPEADATALLEALQSLQDDVRQAADPTMVGWSPRLHRGKFGGSARNIAEWLALRQMDLTPLQKPLSALGLSSLGRLEGHVGASLCAVTASLARIAGQAGKDFPDPEQFSAAAAGLPRRRDDLFGPQEADDPRTRIMVTLPTEAGTDGGTLIGALIAAGTDCFRVNCAHDGPEVWDGMVEHIRAVEAATGRRVPISIDLGGPKFRVTEVMAGKAAGGEKRVLGPGDRFALLRDRTTCPRPCLPLS